MTVTSPMPLSPAAAMPDVATLYVEHHGWLQAWLRRRSLHATSSKHWWA